MEDPREGYEYGHGVGQARERPAPARRTLLHGFANGVAMLVVASVAVLLLVLGYQILLAAFGGVLIGVLLQAPASWVCRKTPLSYLWSLALVVGLILAVVGIGGWFLAPEIFEQMDQLGEKVPELISDLEESLGRYGWGRWLLEQGENGALPAGLLEGGAKMLSALLDLFTYVLVALFVGLFAAASPGMYMEGVVCLAPLRNRERVREILASLGASLRWWLLGQGITMVLIGVSTMIVMWAFGLPLAIVVGLIVGLLGFIPYLGPILGAVPVLLIAVTAGADTLVYVLLAYTGVQMLEGYVAVPLVHERTVFLPPVFTIVTQVLLGYVLGMIGFVMATPLAAVLLVLSRFFRRDVLNDPTAAEELAEG